MYGLEIQKLLIKKEELTLPQDKVKLLQQAITISDSNHDTEWSIHLRLEMMQEELDYLPSKMVSYEAISWIIGAYEEDPAIVDESSFLWQYKWMINYVIKNPSISKAQKDKIIEDYSMRMERNNYSLRPVYEDYYRFYTYFELEEKAKKYKAIRDSTPSDDMSDCKACELNSDFDYNLTFGSIDKAKADGNDILTEKETCARVPIVSYGNLVQELTKENRLEEAKQYVEKGMHQLFKEHEYIPRNFEYLILFAYYYSKVDNDEAWSLLEKFYPSQATNEFSSYNIFLNMLGILKNTDKETISIKLPEWLSFYNSDNIYSKEDLYNYYYNEAKALLEKFASVENDEKILLHLDNNLKEF
ncbi:hypothetical protein [Bernardetia sp. MNP-M8]|uniref:hypothetical protein n=1 Tax=Bernardetia sp. MNP-M8 TaxID=3127470 RepID=UPI0030CCB52A